MQMFRSLHQWMWIKACVPPCRALSHTCAIARGMMPCLLCCWPVPHTELDRCRSSRMPPEDLTQSQGHAPDMVKVLPAPVWPYAMMVALNPSSTEATMSCAHACIGHFAQLWQ